MRFFLVCILVYIYVFKHQWVIEGNIGLGSEYTYSSVASLPSDVYVSEFAKDKYSIET